MAALVLSRLSEPAHSLSVVSPSQGLTVVADRCVVGLRYLFPRIRLDQGILGPSIILAESYPMLYSYLFFLTEILGYLGWDPSP